MKVRLTQSRERESRGSKTLWRVQGRALPESRGSKTLWRVQGRAPPESRGSASGGHSFKMNSTPSVPGPQWQEMTPPARVSMTASK